MVHPYAEKSRKRLTKTPKFYFYDTGLACYLLGIENETQFSSDRMRGHLFENMVVAEIVKHRAHDGKSAELMFYRDSNGNEIDLLVPAGQALEGYDIKSSSTYNSSFEKGFHRITEQLASRSRRAIVYCGNQELYGSPIEVLNYTSLLTQD